MSTKQSAISSQQSVRDWKREYQELFVSAAQSGMAYEEVIAEKNATITRLRTRNEQLEAALRETEWSASDDWGNYCTFCGKLEEDGHKPDCELARLLADEQPADAGEVEG